MDTSTLTIIVIYFITVHNFYTKLEDAAHVTIIKRVPGSKFTSAGGRGA